MKYMPRSQTYFSLSHSCNGHQAFFGHSVQLEQKMAWDWLGLHCTHREYNHIYIVRTCTMEQQDALIHHTVHVP